MLGHALQRVLYGSVPPEGGAFRSAVRWGEEGSAVVGDLLATGKPCLVARLGSSELGCASFYTRWRQRSFPRLRYPDALRRIMRMNAGFFPDEDSSLDRFAAMFLDGVALTDVMAVWFNRGEDAIVERFCPDARLIYLEALNAVLHERPWSSELEGKTVLVVHPFAKTIERQYRDKRPLLFANESTLPEFELKTITAIQSAAGSRCAYATWFDALEYMHEQVAQVDFDVAIIGAGAYGLPLGATVKRMGRQAVHLGGATQLLFGIRGRRWEVESPDDIAPLFNEHWVRPSAEETPDNAGAVEGGCYW